MATSRTGSTTYLRNRKRVLAQAQADGLTRCPGWADTNGAHHACGRELDYTTPLLPESAETDHIVPARFGGTDASDNLSVLCRACNLAKGDGTRTPIDVPSQADFPVSRDWFATDGVGGAPSRGRRPPPLV